MTLKKIIISFLNKIPYIRGLYQETMTYKKNSLFPPGHFYSPIISVDDIKKNQDKIWSNENINRIRGINLNSEEQIKLVNEFKTY